ncbi:MAG TPA: MerR family DNA-binding transcriptional regulator [Caulobacteraceae bacterium]|nr:MerR family DNA-binding transcriptional regulator [Caulobacteraceae bacterium]
MLHSVVTTGSRGIHVRASRGLSIGRLARMSGVHLETIRYYERIGLIPAPGRTEGGHRAYDAPALRRLTFVRRARELGFLHRGDPGAARPGRAWASRLPGGARRRRNPPE